MEKDDGWILSKAGNCLMPWDYSKDTESTPYGDTQSYERAAAWLKDCNTVEDWGCGRAYAKRFFEGQQYTGVDWAPGFADVVEDIALRKSSVDGILMRHVLEHVECPKWEDVLGNALLSSRKLALVVFTPFSLKRTHQIAWNDKEGVPDISFQYGELETNFLLNGKAWKFEDIKSNTQYGSERLFYVGKPCASEL